MQRFDSDSWYSICCNLHGYWKKPLHSHLDKTENIRFLFTLQLFFIITLQIPILIFAMHSTYLLWRLIYPTPWSFITKSLFSKCFIHIYKGNNSNMYLKSNSSQTVTLYNLEKKRAKNPVLNYILQYNDRLDRKIKYS